MEQKEFEKKVQGVVELFSGMVALDCISVMAVVYGAIEYGAQAPMRERNELRRRFFELANRQYRRLQANNVDVSAIGKYKADC